MIYKVIIIGAGPAGMACALQLKRYDIDALLLEANNPGGLLNNANKVENYLGFPGGITGTELIKHFTTQLTAHSIKITQDFAEKIDFSARSSHGLTAGSSDIKKPPSSRGLTAGSSNVQDFKILDSAIKSQNDKIYKFMVYGSKQTYQSEKLILATGTSPIKPNIKLNKKIFFNVIDLMDVKNKRIVIVGAGDAAFDYAINLARHNQVIILNRGKQIKALPLLQRIVEENPNINYIDNVSIDNYLKSNECDYLLFAIGRKPNKPKYANEMTIQESKLLKEKKLFLIGDIKNSIYRQISLAIADGIKTAMEIALENKNENNK
jgi:thioredoxin reductase